jgi:signal transduction histidine kinase
VKNVLAGHVISNYEMSLRSKDERRVILLINGTPRTNSKGEIIGVLLIGQDITELTTYRQSLEVKVRERTNALRSALESEKKLVEVKNRFVSMASHEFRSPISYIHRNIAAVKDHLDTLSIAEVRERLSKIQTHAELLTSLLEDVLTMSRAGANSNRIEAHLAPVSLKDFLNRIIDEVQTNTHNTHRIAMEFPFPDIVLSADESLLRNIFVNLLTNAIKFSPGKNTVVLSIGRCEQHVLVKVKDFGLGIDESDIPRIFEPFHRGHNVQNIKGTGLGLPIVKKAVEALGGEVAVESRNGQGTVFTVKLNLHHA